MANSNIKAIRRVPRFLICLTLLSLLCACFYVPSKEKSVYYNERVDLLVLYQYSVAFFTEDLQSVGDIEIYPVEEDEYGTQGTVLCVDKASTIWYPEPG